MVMLEIFLWFAIPLALKQNDSKSRMRLHPALCLDNEIFFRLSVGETVIDCTDFADNLLDALVAAILPEGTMFTVCIAVQHEGLKGLTACQNNPPKECSPRFVGGFFARDAQEHEM